MGRSKEYAKRAFGLVDRVSEIERDEITAYYYRANGEVDKEIDAWQSGTRNYPREWSFHNQLSVIYVDLGRYEEALKEALEAFRLDPNTDAPYRRQLDAYICLDRLAEAKQLGEKARMMGLDGPRIHQRFLEAAYTGDEQAAIPREIQWFAGKPEEYLSLGLQAAYLNMHGRRRESHNLYQRAAEMALRRGLKSVAGELRGSERAGRRARRQLPDRAPPGPPGAGAGNVRRCGPRRRNSRQRTSKVFPNGTIWNEVQRPTILAAIALNRGSARPERGRTGVRFSVRALVPRAGLLARTGLPQPAQGSGGSSRVSENRGSQGRKLGRYVGPPELGTVLLDFLSRDGDADMHWLVNAENARKAFREFFELWKDADRNIPILREARVEYARLQ